MNIFGLNADNLEKEIKKLLDEYTPEELLQQLKDCGLEINEDDK